VIYRHRTLLLDRQRSRYGDLVGATQLDAAGTDADAGVALGDPVGATQALGAEAVAAAALVGVDCSLANKRDDVPPSTGRPLACS
jgi:hypothetical protein